MTGLSATAQTSPSGIAPSQPGRATRDGNRADVERHDVAEDEIVDVRWGEKRRRGEGGGDGRLLAGIFSRGDDQRQRPDGREREDLEREERLGAAGDGPQRRRRWRVEVVLVVGGRELEDVERLARGQSVGCLLVGDPVPRLLAEDRWRQADGENDDERHPGEERESAVEEGTSARAGRCGGDGHAATG